MAHYRRIGEVPPTRHTQHRDPDGGLYYDVRISYVVTGTEHSPYYRNAIGDEWVYVESGSGVVQTVFGVIDYRGRLHLRPARPRRGRPGGRGSGVRVDVEWSRS
jgi:hypothetical protein